MSSSHAEDETKVLNILAETSKQYERYLELASLARLSREIELPPPCEHNWDTPLDLTLDLGIKHALVE
jgi:hypothetical protein